MKELHYPKEKDNKIIFPICGMGTGSLVLNQNGEICNFDICNNPSVNQKNAFCFFAIEDDNGSYHHLCTNDNPTSTSFDKSDLYIAFPFAKKTYQNKDFSARINQTVFNPLIPFGETDSGIPCSFFEFEIQNTTDKQVRYTLYGVCNNFLPNAKNTVGCTDSGALYISMSSNEEDNFSKIGNLCFATDAKSFSYTEHLSKKELLHLEKDKAYSSLTNESSACLISSHISLLPGEKHVIRYALSWYFPEYYCNNLPLYKNYYSQYFESSTECIQYCFAQWKRLLSETLCFSNTLMESNLPENSLKSVILSISAIKSPAFSRFENGEFIATSDRFCDVFCYFTSLAYLFPSIYKSLSNNELKYISKNRDKVPFLQKLRASLMAYQSFLLEGDFEQLLEIWSDFTRTIESAVLSEDTTFFGKNTYEKLLCACALCASVALSEIVKDKERTGNHSNLLNTILPETKNDILNITDIKDAEGIYFANLFRFEDLFDRNSVQSLLDKVYNDGKNSFMHSFLLMKYGKIQSAVDVLDSGFDFSFVSSKDSLYIDGLKGYAHTLCTSGFSLDLFSKTISIKPCMSFADSNKTYRCFESFGSGYGYIEEGIDYVEINILKGKFTVRNIETSSRPLMILYGGRKWKFQDTGNCARLDCDLILTPEKKLTVIIDVKKTNSN